MLKNFFGSLLYFDVSFLNIPFAPSLRITFSLILYSIMSRSYWSIIVWFSLRGIVSSIAVQRTSPPVFLRLFIMSLRAIRVVFFPLYVSTLRGCLDCFVSFIRFGRICWKFSVFSFKNSRISFGFVALKSFVLPSVTVETNPFSVRRFSES